MFTPTNTVTTLRRFAPFLRSTNPTRILDESNCSMLEIHSIDQFLRVRPTTSILDGRWCLEFGQNGRCPSIRGLLGRTKVMRDFTIFGNQRKTLCAQQYRGGQFQTQSLGQGARIVRQETNARVGSTWRASPSLWSFIKKIYILVEFSWIYIRQYNSVSLASQILPPWRKRRSWRRKWSSPRLWLWVRLVL